MLLLIICLIVFYLVLVEARNYDSVYVSYKVFTETFFGRKMGGSLRSVTFHDTLLTENLCLGFSISRRDIIYSILFIVVL